jgi:hypothetical protein
VRFDRPGLPEDMVQFGSPGRTRAARQSRKHRHPRGKNKNAIDPVDVQETLLRFADEFSTRMIIGAEKLRRGTNALDPAQLLRWKIAYGTGPGAASNAGQGSLSLLMHKWAVPWSKELQRVCREPIRQPAVPVERKQHCQRVASTGHRRIHHLQTSK